MEISENTRELVARALAEDLGDGDVTSNAVVPESARGRARIVQKAPGVLFGLDVVREVFKQAGAESLERQAAEGQWRDEIPAGVGLVIGPARALLAGERVALNLLGHLSGIATLTARYVEAVRDSGAVILDTRKTLPGLRGLEKAAVVAGGGRNHRIGLDDAILLKENHVAIAGGIGPAVSAARAARGDLPIEVECRDAEEVAEALETGAERLLLDNMEVSGLRSAVAARNQQGGSRPELEASGGVSLATAHEIAATGIDFISVGAITHSAPALDLSLLIESA